jgi:transcriptional regulator with XRE-family HTH domain
MMTAKENRRANVKKLVEQYGGQAEFAKRIGKDPAQISQWATAAKSHRGKPRGMSDDMARYIERNCGLDRGWMDTAHNTSSGAAPYRVSPTRRSAEDGGGTDVSSAPSVIKGRKMKLGEARPEKRQHTPRERPMRRPNSVDGKSMGQRIAELRKAMGWRPAELAWRVGVSRMTVGQWESGVIKNIKNATFSRLALLLGCSERYLATGVDERESRRDDRARMEFLNRMRASVQFTSDGKWAVWYSNKNRVFLKQGDALRATIDSAMELPGK